MSNRNFPTISLSTVKPKGIPVEIDGRTYETVPPSWWGAEWSARARKHLREVTRFEEQILGDGPEDPSDEEVRLYKYHLRELVKLMLPDAPPDLLESLSDPDLQIIAETFMRALRNYRTTVTSSAPNGTTSTSETASPESAGTIPATLGVTS